jgi:hypothetical protein
MLAFLVTHDELHALLPTYAAGELDEETADAVREHLATGCADCLGDLFARPVGRPAPDGVPRSAVEAEATVLPPPTGLERGTVDASSTSRRGERWALVAVLLLGLALAALGTWNIYDLRLREVMQRQSAARLARRLAEVEAARVELTARLETLGNDLAAARDEAARHADAVRATAEDGAQLATELEAAQSRIGILTRGLRRRDVEIGRLLGGADDVTTVRDLLATPGVEVLRLQPVPPFAEVRGHVVWHPAREVLVLYAFGLPPPDHGALYRVWLDLGGREDRGPTFIPGPRGDTVLAVRLGTGAARLRGVQVVREPAAEPVLAGQVARSAG